MRLLYEYIQLYVFEPFIQLVFTCAVFSNKLEILHSRSHRPLLHKELGKQPTTTALGRAHTSATPH